MKLIILTLLLISLTNTGFAQVGKVEIDSTRHDTLVSLANSIQLTVTNNDSMAIELDFDKYSNGTSLYAFVIKVQTGKVLSFIEKDSCVLILNDKISITLKSVYVDAFAENERYNNWIHFDYPPNILMFLQNITAFEIKLYNLGQLYEAKMREEDVNTFNEYIKNYIIKN